LKKCISNLKFVDTLLGGDEHYCLIRNFYLRKSISTYSRRVLDTPLSKLRETPWQQIRGILLASLAIVAIAIGAWYAQPRSSPYITSVFARTGDPTLGHAIFQINCSGCHGLNGGGRVGPSLYDISKRKSPHSLIEQVTSGNTPPMPQFQPSPQEMADLLSYLASL
jgi:mono/diheme cytochrome c family protein